MARKFSKLSEKDLSIAVSRYNQMRTRYIKSGGKTVAPKITTQELKAQSENTAQLRQQIKRLNDYKKIADFESAKVKGFRFATTKGERRTISRLDRAARQRYKKEIAKLASVSEKTVEREMKKMSNLRYVGRGYSGHWEIISSERVIVK